MPFKNKSPLYSVWSDMRQRCRNPRYPQWKDYGGRGITICPTWDDYKQFAADMGERPAGHTLDRIDNDGPYSKENCRWASRKDQARNQRVTRTVLIEGLRYCAADLADLSGLKTDTIVQRAAQGLTYEQVVDPKRRTFTAGLALGGHASGKRRRDRTHCLRGHPYTEENTYVTADGARRCRKCRTIEVKRAR